MFGSTAFADVVDSDDQQRVLLWRIISEELRVSEGRYRLQTGLLGRFLRLMSGKSLPWELLDYLANLADGKLRHRRGRKKSADIATRNAMIKSLYRMYLWENQTLRSEEGSKEQQERHRRRSSDDPPHVVAAKLTAQEVRRMGYPMLDWRAVQNIASSDELS